MLVPWDYQEKAAKVTLPGLWRQGFRSPILVSPIGSGKTVIACLVAHTTMLAGQADFWMLAHRIELVSTPKARLWRDFQLPANQHTPGEKIDYGWPVNVASVDTLANREIRPCRPKAVVVFDESHRIVSARQHRLVERFRETYGEKNVFFLLLTATPYRLDGRSLGDVADALVEITTPKELIARGLIMEPTVLGLESPDMTGVASRGGEFVQEAKSERTNTRKLVGNVVDSWIQYSGGAPSIYFATDIVHSQHLAQRFREVGVRAIHLDGSTPAEERQRGMVRLAIGGRGSDHPQAVDVVCNVGLFGEGWDSESSYEPILTDPTLRDLWLGKSYPPEYQPLEVLGDCDSTQSCCKYRQREGRVCRSHKKKTKALILGHASNHERHGFLRDHEGFALDDRQMKETMARRARVSMYSARHCAACMAVWPPGTETCSCGASLSPPPKLPTETEAKLVDVSNTKTIAPPNPKEEFAYLRALWSWWARENMKRIANGKPKASDWQVASIFKKKYHRWPSQQVLRDARKEAGV